MKTGMLVSISQSLGRATTVAPMTLLALFAGILWLIGLFCGKDRRTYVVKLNSQVMDAMRSTLAASGEQEASPEATGGSSHSTHRPDRRRRPRSGGVRR